MARGSSPSRPKVVPARGKLGTYVAYDRAGAEIWTSADFALGKSRVPYGISLTMGAGLVVDPATGEPIHRWDPWGVLVST